MNSDSARAISKFPELARIDDKLWQMTRSNTKDPATKPGYPTRSKSKRLLSGKLKCGVCGSDYVVLSKDRVGCSNFRYGKGCENNRSVSMPLIEQRVFTTIREGLLDADGIESLVNDHVKEREKLRRELIKTTEGNCKKIAKIEMEISNIVDAISAGVVSKALASRLASLEQGKDDLEESSKVPPKLEGIDVKCVIEKHQSEVRELRLIVKTEDRRAARPIIRKLIDEIVIHPKGSHKPVELEIHGDLNSLLSPERFAVTLCEINLG